MQPIRGDRSERTTGIRLNSSTTQSPSQPPPSPSLLCCPHAHAGCPHCDTDGHPPRTPISTEKPAMPRGKTAGKASGKPARQLLFSEALRQQKHSSTADSSPLPHAIMSEDAQGVSMDRILQEISAVGRKLEGMDNAMTALTAETRSMRLEIVGFQSQISGLDHRVAAVESQVALQTDRDQELLHLRSKLTDLEDRSRRNNIRFLGFPEGIEGTDILSYLRDMLPKLADTTFDPLWNFKECTDLVSRDKTEKTALAQS
ncbi:hypothetical protein NDU88_001775 [Pleurodeles waltl]|uniref:Uncharacterized protein n=1 Tax=Pleurodeles waltl TaxID=8319 RepID=A0AAV7NK48_PLEWA|nr:hypothetical protein NDU88_001775 [Pleurodeles waltl]